MTGESLHVREARHDDYETVVSFTQDTWSDRGMDDYLPDVYHDWVEKDALPHRTVVAELDGEVVGLAQSVLLSDWEAWNQGLRVAPKARGRGVSIALTEDLFDWAREQGATSAGVMVFSWNAAGLGQARATGYEPATEFRWAHPDPDPEATPDCEVTSDPNAAWHFWTQSDACDALSGYALDHEESWAVSQLTRGDLQHAADDDGLFVVHDDGTRGFAHRVREYDRQTDDGCDHWVEYGVGAWDDADSATALFDAIARDAGERGADRTRVLIPETVEAVSDTAACRVDVSDEPDFVLTADLTAR